MFIVTTQAGDLERKGSQNSDTVLSERRDISTNATEHLSTLKNEIIRTALDREVAWYFGKD